MEFSLKPLCWYNSSYSFCYTYFVHTALGNNGKNNSQKRLWDQDFILFKKNFGHTVCHYTYIWEGNCAKNRNQGNVAFWHLVKVSAGIPSSMTHNICQKSLWDTRLENCLIWLKMSNETAALAAFKEKK